MARTIAWYSDGVASAVALKLAKEKYSDVLAVYCATNSEHPDNAEFRKHVEAWTGVKIQKICSDTFKDVNDVIEKKKFLRGPNGAPCTVELKKIPSLKFQKPDDRHIFGYTYDEGIRIVRLLSENWDLKIECPLFSEKIKKQDCYSIVEKAGIELPPMYRLGFDNNNCIGCVKAEGPDYWLRVKEHFPEEFYKRAEQERRLNFALARWRKKPVFLDELKPHMKSTKKQKNINCDFLCGGN